jgi:Rrf2 family protein
MNLSPVEEYGLRCALQLAREYESGKLLSASQIADREGISIEYVSKFMFQFRSAGLIKSTRGARGGFRLTQSPQELNLKDVFSSLKTRSEKIDSKFCERFKGKKDQCVHLNACDIRPVWGVLNDVLDHFLIEVKLSDFLRASPNKDHYFHNAAALPIASLKQKLSLVRDAETSK